MPDTYQTSRLLSLPGELRNSIYEYVLTSDKGFDYVSNSDAPPTVSSSSSVVHPNTSIVAFRELGIKQHFNKLKHTCKQLAAETYELELRYNDFTVATGSVPALQLLNELGKECISLLRTVNVKPYLEPADPRHGSPTTSDPCTLPAPIR
jgi:hypothetical protein